MLLLPLRVASVAALTIPVTILTTLGILNLLGVQLQTVSLAGLIVVLGMAVDDPIVVIDDHVERLGHGATPWTAAWRSAQELVVPGLHGDARHHHGVRAHRLLHDGHGQGLHRDPAAGRRHVRCA